MFFFDASWEMDNVRFLLFSSLQMCVCPKNPEKCVHVPLGGTKRAAVSCANGEQGGPHRLRGQGVGLAVVWFLSSTDLLSFESKR